MKIKRTLTVALVCTLLLCYSFAQDRKQPVSAVSVDEPSIISAVAGTPRKPVAVGHPSFMSPHASPIAISGGNVFVVNTPSDTVDVIDSTTRKIQASGL